MTFNFNVMIMNGRAYIPFCQTRSILCKGTGLQDFKILTRIRYHCDLQLKTKLNFTVQKIKGSIHEKLCLSTFV